MACGESVFTAIINEVHTANYFSMIVDVTPDVSHTEAITFVLQFVHLSSDNQWVVMERYPNLENLEKKEGCRHFDTDYGRFGLKLNLVKELLRVGL